MGACVLATPFESCHGMHPPSGKPTIWGDARGMRGPHTRALPTSLRVLSECPRHRGANRPCHRAATDRARAIRMRSLALENSRRHPPHAHRPSGAVLDLRAGPDLGGSGRTVHPPHIGSAGWVTRNKISRPPPPQIIYSAHGDTGRTATAHMRVRTHTLDDVPATTTVCP